jgi:DNA-binding GntR family transcriptional regulator
MAEITPSTLKSHLVQRLREAILAGEYKPGDRLNESLIAREFKISRIPVREALFQLQESGLVMNHERRGMFVTLLSKEDVQKINSVRIILETEALKLARARMTPELEAELSAQVNKIESWNGTEGTVAEAAALDLEFHRTLWAASGNDCLVRVLDSLATVLFAHKTLEHVSHELRKWRLNHHRALLDVVLSPRQLDIQEAVVMHLRMAYPEPERFSSIATPASDLPAPSKRERRAAMKFQAPVTSSHQNPRGVRRRRRQRAPSATRIGQSAPVDAPRSL